MWETDSPNPLKAFNRCFIFSRRSLPSRELTYPTKREKENHRLKSALGKGYVTLPETNVAPENRPSQ